MTASVTLASGQLAPVRSHLASAWEQVGFFLADYDEQTRDFRVRDWWPMPSEAFDLQMGDHVVLRDDMRPQLIKWAWDSKACLGEIHSHGDFGDACFSRFDLEGFASWVPHVRWRLRARPYFALVADGATFDGLAWLGDAGPPVQVSVIDGDAEPVVTTGLTLARISEERDQWA